MFLTRDGKPDAVIVIGPQATWIERHAAEELAKYVKAMSGADLPIVTDPAGAESVVAIGREETNALVAEAGRRGMIELSENAPGLDGFVIRALEIDGRNVLVLGGSQDRGTLYAVYALLESVLGVGFYRDGERIPSQPTIEVGRLDIRERPRFEGRHDGNGCMYNYSAMCWTWDDWKRELDWKAKRRVNCMYAINELESALVPEILAGWGVRTSPAQTSAYCRQHARMVEYARKLGIRVPFHIPALGVSDELLEVFPNTRTITSDWCGFAPIRTMHPADPLFRRFIVEFIRWRTERYGTDHLYFANFLSEARLLGGAGDRHQVNLEFARATSDALREADPDAVWLVDTWSFDMDSSDPLMRWSADQVNEYLDAIKVPIVVWDLWSEESEKYKRTSYFGGKPWGFGVLHSFGGSSYPQGDVSNLLERVHEIDQTSGGERCKWFISAPEIVDFNGFYFELAALLSWNPAAITLDGYVETYCRRRYGDQGAKVFGSVFPELLASIHGPRSGSIVRLTDPLYWFWPRPGLYVGMPEYREEALARRRERIAYIPRLERALLTLCRDWPALEGNAMAEHDLVDIARSWIAERFNAALMSALDAFGKGDSASFEADAALCLSLLEQQTRLLATWPAYRLDDKIERGRAIWGDDACRAIKHAHVWVYTDAEHETQDLKDYYRMDLDGLVRDYYRPRIAAYLDLLRGKMDRREPAPERSELEALCDPFSNAFVAAPYEPMPRGERPVDAVRCLLDAAGCVAA